MNPCILPMNLFQNEPTTTVLLNENKRTSWNLSSSAVCVWFVAHWIAKEWSVYQNKNEQSLRINKTNVKKQSLSVLNSFISITFISSNIFSPFNFMYRFRRENARISRIHLSFSVNCQYIYFDTLKECIFSHCV